MLLVLACLAVLSGLFFYCQALMSGLGRRRWAFAGVVFGPLLWPMFCMKKRMKHYQSFGLNCLIFNA